MIHGGQQGPLGFEFPSIFPWLVALCASQASLEVILCYRLCKPLLARLLWMLLSCEELKKSIKEMFLKKIEVSGGIDSLGTEFREGMLFNGVFDELVSHVCAWVKGLFTSHLNVIPI